ncbi:hypothetical protein [Streptomyces globisporus]|uniref:hypothetical protein n=1 Tax=Streptomyces globisporus TaxID=1908 RepID=UPI0038302C16
MVFEGGLASGRSPWAGARVAGRVSPGMPRPVRDRATASLAYRARRSPHGRHVVLPEADHMVLTTSAAELAEEIRRLAVGADD